MMSIKKNSTVKVLSGKDKGKEGIVLEISPKHNQVKVKDVAILVHHKKARRQGEVSGIIRAESFIDISKVMAVCGSCKQPTRAQVKIVDNKKALSCKRCNEII